MNLSLFLFIAVYLIGPLIFDKSWVPILTSFLLLHIFWCNLSCKLINDSYEALVRFTPLRIQPTHLGLIFLTIGSITILYFSARSSFCINLGISCNPRYVLNAITIPSTQSKSYLFAGTSILYITRSSLFVISFPCSESHVISSSSTPYLKHKSSR